ncbi:hypothetical protein OZ411_35950 [Bradyrhizobium sp. Arg237L]|uniref:hypothetical protein n=1 Tax=Bradyrhizobium sp. Arg237L TaxID=3003352 RepID=UPI00249EA3A6|nr:hypothetical protein [Bradyrhizobium sp. Arg237L]MDI4238208.1 hypothetical protein [Bradyrhizobium sp. Arg237L]
MLLVRLGRGSLVAAACVVIGLLASEGRARSETLGVRHRIDVVVSAEPNAPVMERLRGSKGSLSFTVRLSANSQESRYFGMLSPSFSDIVVPENASTPLVAQTKIWEEETCHQRRGLPKVTVTKIKANFGDDKNGIEVSSINRHIGLRVPSDELTPGIKLGQGSDESGSFYAVRAQTRDSRLNVDLKIYPFDCFF